MMKYNVIECNRNHVSVYGFYSYCKRRCEIRGLDMERYVNFDTWSNPPLIILPKYTLAECDEEHKPYSMITPFYIHLYEHAAYNFIMRYDFETEKSGFGYMFLAEMKQALSKLKD